MGEIIYIDGWWTGFILFGITFLAHIAVWRTHRLKRDFLGLLAVFFLFPAALILLGGPGLLWGEWPAIVTHIVLSLHYIALYPAVQAVSPSLEILLEISHSGRTLTEKEIQSRFNSARLVGDRFQQLVTGKLVRQTAAGPRVTTPGKALAIAFLAYRRTLGLPQGVG